jgi:hypothetical protein
MKLLTKPRIDWYYFTDLMPLFVILFIAVLLQFGNEPLMFEYGNVTAAYLVLLAAFTALDFTFITFGRMVAYASAICAALIYGMRGFINLGSHTTIAVMCGIMAYAIAGDAMWELIGTEITYGKLLLRTLTAGVAFTFVRVLIEFYGKAEFFQQLDGFVARRMFFSFFAAIVLVIMFNKLPRRQPLRLKKRKGIQ